MRAGFTRVPNSIFESKLWLAGVVHNRLSALIDLMGMAQFEDTTFEGDNETIEIKKGSAVVSQTVLCERWKWTRKQVYRFFRYLEQHHNVTISKHGLDTVIFFPHLGDVKDTLSARDQNAIVPLLARCRPVVGPLLARDRPVVDAKIELKDQVVNDDEKNDRPVVGPLLARCWPVVGPLLAPKMPTYRLNNNNNNNNNNNTYSGEGCGENQNSSLPLVEHPPLSFSDDDFPDFEELAPKTEVIDDFPDSEPVETPPPPSTEKPVEWPDNPTEGALFKKEELPAPPKKAKKTPDKPQEPKLEVRPNVWLTKVEAERFKLDFPEKKVREYYAAMLSDYKEENPNWAKKRTSDNRTLRNWIRRDQVEGRGPYKPKPSWTQEKKQEEPQRPRYKTAEETRQMLLKQLGVTEGD